ncbi:MAG: ribosome maturation factor RimM [Desulfococcaceae bacterium]
MIRIGRVAGPHGVTGWVKVRPDDADSEAFVAGRAVRLVGRDGAALEMEIREARPHGKFWRLRLSGVSDREAAAALSGAEICMARGDLPELEPDSFYWADLVGLRVYDIRPLAGECAPDPAGRTSPPTVVAGDSVDAGRFLGRLESVIETGGNDVYVVRDGDRETLVPALSWVVETVDLASGVMRVNLPEGL